MLKGRSQAIDETSNRCGLLPQYRPCQVQPAWADRISAESWKSCQSSVPPWAKIAEGGILEKSRHACLPQIGGPRHSSSEGPRVIKHIRIPEDALLPTDLDGSQTRITDQRRARPARALLASPATCVGQAVRSDALDRLFVQLESDNFACRERAAAKIASLGKPAIVKVAQLTQVARPGGLPPCHSDSRGHVPAPRRRILACCRGRAVGFGGGAQSYGGLDRQGFAELPRSQRRNGASNNWVPSRSRDARS